MFDRLYVGVCSTFRINEVYCAESDDSLLRRHRKYQINDHITGIVIVCKITW